jgi:uncharacterized lipoprotein YajG
LKLGAVLSGTLMLAACQTTRSSVQVSDVACTVFSPITYASQDTAPTVRQIRGHNAAWVATCRGAE